MFMGKRKNLVHEKIKRAKPNDLVAFQVRLPAYLLSDVKRYGDSTKFIRTALELAQKKKFKFGLLEIISDLRKQIELLELWQNSEQDENSKMDEEHLLLLETYRYTYLQLRETNILKRRRT